MKLHRRDRDASIPAGKSAGAPIAVIAAGWYVPRPAIAEAGGRPEILTVGRRLRVEPFLIVIAVVVKGKRTVWFDGTAIGLAEARDLIGPDISSVAGIIPTIEEQVTRNRTANGCGTVWTLGAAINRHADLNTREPIAVMVNRTHDSLDAIVDVSIAVVVGIVAGLSRSWKHQWIVVVAVEHLAVLHQVGRPAISVLIREVDPIHWITDVALGNRNRGARSTSPSHGGSEDATLLNPIATIAIVAILVGLASQRAVGFAPIVANRVPIVAFFALLAATVAAAELHALHVDALTLMSIQRYARAVLTVDPITGAAIALDPIEAW